MYQRYLTIPNYSFFLFGPRGTGKTTWLREKLSNALWINLLHTKDYLFLLGQPEALKERILAREEGWVVIDEVQKIPVLLNEVHDLISLYGKKYLFALSGSSARKLKRLDVNLLAGRVLDKKFFPLVYPEFGEAFDLERILSVGCLPGIYPEQQLAAEILESYVGTYLREEIQQEALVENLDSFVRFLKVAAIVNGEVLQTSSVASDCGVARKTVERYFQTLVDTLVAFWLPAWQPKLKVRERSRPKFYFFDSGVIRALTGRLRLPLHDLEKGSLLETYLLHELRAANMYRNLGGEFSYYNGGNEEVDVIWSWGEERIGFEIKSNKTWRSEYGKTLRLLLESGKLKQAYGIYCGTEELQSSKVRVLPVELFLKKLWNGEISINE